MSRVERSRRERRWMRRRMEETGDDEMAFPGPVIRCPSSAVRMVERSRRERRWTRGELKGPEATERHAPG